MRFAPGSLDLREPQRTKRLSRKEFARVCADILDEEGVKTIVSILRGRNASARVQCLRLLAEFAIGKPVDPKLHAHLNGDSNRILPGSPEAVLLQIAGQPLPTNAIAAEVEEDDDRDDDRDE